jgi:hypothetical protein
MLSLPTRYSAQSQTQNVVKDWLLEIAYTDAVDGNGTLRLSGASRNVTNLYHGLVSDWGVIDESIDLANSQSSTADIQITVNNSWANVSGLLSAELFGGNKKFINQNVTIRSWIAGCDAVTDCLIMYVGRLVDIKHNLSSVTFTIEKRSPWDRVKVGKVVSENNRVMFPEAYGEYTRNNSSVAAKDFVPNKLLFPCPVNDILGVGIIGLLPAKASLPDTADLHYFEPSLDIFVPLDPVTLTAKTAFQGGYAISAPNNLKRGFDFRPTGISTTDPGDFTNPGNAIDGNTATYAIKSFSGLGTTVDAFDLFVDVPAISGRLTDIDLAIKYDLTLTAGSGVDSQLGIWDASYGGSSPELNIVNNNVTQGSTLSGAETIHSVSGYSTATWFNSDRYQASNTLPTVINLRAVFADIIPSEAVIGDCKIYDIIIRIATELDFSTEEAAGYDKLAGLRQLYTGTDGFAQGFTGGSGVASYPHDILRDMVNRYAGWDAAEANAVAVNGALWGSSSIDTDRNWPCRWWTLSQKPLVEILRQLQFEGAFIWIFDFTSTISATEIEARVIYVKTSYSSSDHTLDGNNLANIDVSMTPFSEIVTTRKANYQRHPADEKRYLAQNSKVNANLADYNLDALENIVEHNLDFLTATADVDEHLTYYDSITGEPKVLVQADLLKPSDWTMQVGDSVQFQNMPYEPYGRTFESPIYFMCVRTVPSPTKFTAYFREVYEA